MGIFVGRSAELDSLDTTFDRAHQGCLQVVTIEGDAGIGKTRLLQELAKRILPTGAAFCVGHCLEYIRAPYLPFAEIFRSLGVAPPTVQLSVSTDCDGDAKFRYFDAVAALLIEKSAERTLVVAIEDTHWADDATIELVQYLALRLRESRVLLVLTQRSDSPQSASAIGLLLVRLLRLGAKHVRVQPLSHEDASALLFSLANHAAMSPDVASLIEATADGNPFFLEELVRNARDHADADVPHALQIPLTIKAMLSERMLALTDRERDVLMNAAVVGRHFDVDFLCAISGHSREDVWLSLQRARDLLLVVPDGTRRSHYSFRHALLRESLYQALPVDIARTLHSRVAERIEAGPQTAGVFAELAHHWSAAGNESKAIEASERAGDAATEMFAYSDAVRFYLRAAAQNPGGPRRARLYERLALAFRSAGGNEETRLWFDRAYDDYRQLGDSESMVRVLLLLAFQDWLDCNTEGSVRCATQALCLLEDLDRPQLLVNARLAKAGYCSTLGRVEEARELLDSVAAMEFARDDETNALFHEIVAETEIALDFGDEALASVAVAATHAQRTGSADTISRVENMAVITCSLVADFHAAETHFDRAFAAAQENGLLWRAAHACVHYADTLVLAGRLEAARDVLERGLASAIASPTIRACAAFTGIPLASMLEDRALLARLADERLLEDAFRSAEPQRIGPISAAFAEMYAAGGQFDRARALLRSAIPEKQTLSLFMALSVAGGSTLRSRRSRRNRSIS